MTIGIIGAGGIGQAFARRLAQDGVHIAVADIAPADETVAQVEAAGRETLACTCDVASPESVSALKQQILVASADVGKNFCSACVGRTACSKRIHFDI